MVMFKQSYTSEIVKPYHSVLSCAQNEVNRISNNFCKFTKKQIYNIL
jgi:lipid II:glycine glycyltransferase (peptidoglycan interpeptide bridge formation enzyme)